MTAPSPDTTPGPAPIEAAALTRGGLLARNAFWNLLTQAVPMAVAIATMPLLIRGLGTERFGVMTLAWMVLGYFSLFDLGLGRALTKMVAERLGLGLEAEVPGLVWTSMILMTALGLVGTAVVAVVTPWLVDGALRITGPLRAESLGAFYLMGLALPFVVGTAGLRGAMEAHQRFDGINRLRTATSLYILLAPLAILSVTPNLVAIVGAVCLGRVAGWLGHVLICAGAIPGLRLGPTFRSSEVRSLLGYGGWMTAVNVINPFMVQVDRLLIGSMVSAAAVAYYATPQELITRSWFLSNAVLGVMFPAFAASFVRDRVRTARLFGRCLSHVGLILFPVAMIAVSLSRDILGLWLGREFADQGSRVLQWLAVGVLINGLAQVPSALIQGIGRPDLTFKIHLAELPLYLAAAVSLIRYRGIEGAAVAWTARTALDLWLYATATGTLLPEARAVLRGLWSWLAAGLLALAALAAPLGPAYRASALVVVGAGFLALGWGRLLAPEERLCVVNAFTLVRAFARRKGEVPGPVAVVAAEHPVPRRGL